VKRENFKQEEVEDEEDVLKMKTKMKRCAEVQGRAKKTLEGN